MALTRKMLEAMGIEGDKVDQIIDMHAETVEALKAQRDENQGASDELDEARKRIADIESQLEQSRRYKERYEDAQKELDDLKASIETERDRTTRESLYRGLLRDSGISERRIDQVLRVSDLNALEFGDDGSLSNADDLKASIAEEWSEFIPASEVRGAAVETPPTSASGGMTKDEIMAIKNPVQRQKAMAENIQLFE